MVVMDGRAAGVSAAGAGQRAAGDGCPVAQAAATSANLDPLLAVIKEVQSKSPSPILTRRRKASRC